MMDDTTVDEWMNFFRDAGIPPNVSASYASSFCQNRIHLNMVLELNRDLLKELGVNLIGDAIAILRHAKSFHEQNVRQKILGIMSSECQKEHKKPEECNKKVVSTTDVGSINNRWFDDEAETTEEMSTPCSASRKQNSLRTSYSECFLMRGPVESSSTLPIRQATVSSHVSGGNYICRRNQGIKRPMQQSPVSTIVSTSQQPAGRLPCETENTHPTACQSIRRIEHNTFEDTPDEILATTNMKRKRTLSCCGPIEEEQFDPNVCMQSVCTRAVNQSVYDSQSTAERVQSEGLQVQESSQLDISLPRQLQESSQLDISLPRQDVKNEMIETEDPVENHSSFYPRCQLPLQRRQEESPTQTCTQDQSQERMQVFQSLPNKQSQSQTMSVSQFPSHVASSSQSSFLRRPNSHMQYQPALKLHHESQSSLCLQPSVQPKTAYAVSSQSNAHKNVKLQNKKVMQCNSARSCSTTKLILATGKNINKKFKLLHSFPRTPCVTPAPHSTECTHGNEVQRPISSWVVCRCNNKSVVKKTENEEKGKLSLTVLESDNATCVLQNGSQTKFIDAGGDLLGEEMNALTDTSAVRRDTQQLSKPLAHTSDSCLYEGSSSHTFNNSSNDAENNLQHERVPGQIFSRLGVKVELVSVDNNDCNTSVKNDTLPTCRFGNNVKYKINKPKKHKNLASKFAKIMAVKQLPRNKLLKRKIMFTAFQKTSTIGGQNIVPDQTRQGVTSINGGQPQLRGILKPQTITLEQREDMEPEEEDQSQKMTANKLLESVARSRASDLGVVCDAVHYLSNDSTKSKDGDYICQSTDNFCSDDEQQEELSRAPTSDTCKTVRFGPVCIKEFEKDTLSSSGKTATNSRPPIFRRLGARRKGI
ncbi:uncharacterized protein LOC126198598 isoform X2 [Schistocerca nitens]|uniref:uncharacterized protein LOC126198598 isoform X2 n=1 Tax=Schistocerca nitens TaxID=7011 RepID=UPI0021194FB2|nr:uncharacterized protein LOC126198598 isoform X2 [Schistocerca nitens]